MNDYGDFCREMRERRKEGKKATQEKAHREGGLIDKIEEMGAEFKTAGVWRLGDDDIYPYRGWVRNVRTNKSCSIDYWLNVLMKRKEEK